uniref:Uncharacterized protein n=1 Tax=Rangifer tarandus platyrhynchus TaxID=3082113 RepID=A0ACB0DY00_RANTA|nr:unnamed protein product [Rangifer tarandus platyrhynchus]
MPPPPSLDLHTQPHSLLWGCGGARERSGSSSPLLSGSLTRYFGSELSAAAVAARFRAKISRLRASPVSESLSTSSSSPTILWEGLLGSLSSLNHRLRLLDEVARMFISSHFWDLLLSSCQHLPGCSAEAATEEVVELLFLRIPSIGRCEAVEAAIARGSASLFASLFRVTVRRRP